MIKSKRPVLNDFCTATPFFVLSLSKMVDIVTSRVSKPANNSFKPKFKARKVSTVSSIKAVVQSTELPELSAFGEEKTNVPKQKEKTKFENYQKVDFSIRDGKKFELENNVIDSKDIVEEQKVFNGKSKGNDSDVGKAKGDELDVGDDLVVGIEKVVDLVVGQAEGDDLDFLQTKGGDLDVGKVNGDDLVVGQAKGNNLGFQYSPLKIFKEAVQVSKEHDVMSKKQAENVSSHLSDIEKSIPKGKSILAPTSISKPISIPHSFSSNADISSFPKNKQDTEQQQYKAGKKTEKASLPLVLDLATATMSELIRHPFNEGKLSTREETRLQEKKLKKETRLQEKKMKKLQKNDDDIEKVQTNNSNAVSEQSNNNSSHRSIPKLILVNGELVVDKQSLSVTVPTFEENNGVVIDEDVRII